MVRTLIFVLAIIGFNAVASSAINNGAYTDKYDYIDVQPILDNDRLREEYYSCFMFRGPCITAAAKYLKDFMEEIFDTDCAKCNPVQKMKFMTIRDFYKNKKPEQWKEIQERIASHKVKDA